MRRLGLLLAGGFIAALQVGAQNVPSGRVGQTEPLPPGVREGWRARFDQAYRLQEGQALKYIPPPFIAERWDYYHVEHASRTQVRPEPPSAFDFIWHDPPQQNVQLRMTTADFGENAQPLSDVLTREFRLKFYEYEGPEELLRVVFPGDWIIRAGSETKAMEELARILSQARGKTVKIERQSLLRDSVVVSGDYQFKPLPQAAAGDRSVHEFIDAFETQEDLRAQQRVSFPLYLSQLESRLRIRFINEVQVSPPSITKTVHPSFIPQERPTTMESAENVRKILDVLASQTGLKFSREQRPCDVWRLTEDR